MEALPPFVRIESVIIGRIDLNRCQILREGAENFHIYQYQEMLVLIKPDTFFVSQ